MYVSTQNFTPMHTVFGGGYIPEQHSDETHRHLSLPENRSPVVNFGELLKALRSALSLRQKVR